MNLGLRIAVMAVGKEPLIEFLEAVAPKNPNREAKGRARLAIAEILYDGSPDPGEICRKWHVRAYPTTLVLDHEGVIRYKDVLLHELENVVNGLLAELPEPTKD